jgi:hypothetical protein
MSDFNEDDFRTKLLAERDRLLGLLGDARFSDYAAKEANKLVYTLKVVETYLDTGEIIIPD